MYRKAHRSLEVSLFKGYCNQRQKLNVHRTDNQQVLLRSEPHVFWQGWKWCSMGWGRHWISEVDAIRWDKSCHQFIDKFNFNERPIPTFLALRCLCQLPWQTDWRTFVLLSPWSCACLNQYCNTIKISHGLAGIGNVLYYIILSGICRIVCNTYIYIISIDFVHFWLHWMVLSMAQGQLFFKFCQLLSAVFIQLTFGRLGWLSQVWWLWILKVSRRLCRLMRASSCALSSWVTIWLFYLLKTSSNWSLIGFYWPGTFWEMNLYYTYKILGNALLIWEMYPTEM